MISAVPVVESESRFLFRTASRNVHRRQRATVLQSKQEVQDIVTGDEIMAHGIWTCDFVLKMWSGKGTKYQFVRTVGEQRLGCERAHGVEESVHEHEVDEVLVADLGGCGVGMGRAPWPWSFRGLSAVVDAVGVVQVVVPREGEVEGVHDLQAREGGVHGPQLLKLLQLLHEDAVVDLHFVRVGEAIAGMAGLLFGVAGTCDGGSVDHGGRGVLPESLPEGDGVVDAFVRELAGCLVEVRVMEARVHHHGVRGACFVEVRGQERAVLRVLEAGQAREVP